MANKAFASLALLQDHALKLQTEANCNHCLQWMPPSTGDMGTCRNRNGDAQYRYGVCLDWRWDGVL